MPHVEITEKTKKKTTLKKRIVKERQKVEFLKKSGENEKDEKNTGPQVLEPDQIMKKEENVEEKKEKNIKIIREYVDQELSKEIDIHITNLIFGLRKQYMRQKIEKPGKKIPKNYVFGIKEVLKHIEAKYFFPLIEY